MNQQEIDAALDRMPIEVRRDLRAIVYGDSPTKENEARTLIELFHYFPKMERTQILKAPVFDDEQTQRRWEEWSAQ